MMIFTCTNVTLPRIVVNKYHESYSYRSFTLDLT
jgi:hypothetical protein